MNRSTQPALQFTMSATTPVRQKQEIGLPVADFTLPLISGEGQRSLADFLSGNKHAVVVFWSGVCSHCLLYDDYLNGLRAQHPELGLLAIAARYRDRPYQLR